MQRIFLVLTIAGSLGMAPMAFAQQNSPAAQSKTQTQGNTGSVSHGDTGSISHGDTTMSDGKAKAKAKTHPKKMMSKKKAKPSSKPSTTAPSMAQPH